MRKRYFRWVMCPLTLISLAACATYGDIRSVQDDLIRIEEKVNQLPKRLGTQTQAEKDVPLRNQAKILSEIEELKNKLQSINGSLETSNFRLEELFHDLEFLIVRTVEETTPASPPTAISGLPSAAQPVPPGTIPSAEAPTTTPPSPPPLIAGITPETIYQTAYNDYVRGNYSLAILGLKEFLNKFPQSELSPNAQYWLGECYYSLKDYETAVKEFEQVAINYPQSNKAPGALLKLSYSLAELQQPAEAKAKLNELLIKYPNSPEADQARKRLLELEP